MFPRRIRNGGAGMTDMKTEERILWVVQRLGIVLICNALMTALILGIALSVMVHA